VGRDAGHPIPVTFGPDDLARQIPVSRETREALETHLNLLEAWNRRLNLVGPGELAEYWRRHALDSAQLVSVAPSARSWVDLGSGAGFPGLIIACCLKGQEGASVDLVESNSKKAAFLREAIRACAAPARVLPVRAETLANSAQAYAVVTARAFAPLDRIIDLAAPILQRGAVGLFLKGATVEAELAEAGKRWDLAYELLPSLSDPNGRIVRVDGARSVSS
jgi:16S rRNA (guanine527-N7)-methyltransferase